MRFARVERTHQPTAGASPSTRESLTIIWGDARLRIPPGFDTQTLDAVLGALARHARPGAR